ncbi:hypothetical protein SAMN04487951_12417 [Vreelandella arcis]|uniref:Uncharacterized protein n=1 Tax=Vreelandella arcis TaxID=416873 RepID=A0A1H0J6R8_9GAMM|nr:hypothetical protein SAMN04487951_12417 [Halomonas arcis]
MIEIGCLEACCLNAIARDTSNRRHCTLNDLLLSLIDRLDLKKELPSFRLATLQFKARLPSVALGLIISRYPDKVH